MDNQTSKCSIVHVRGVYRSRTDDLLTASLQNPLRVIRSYRFNIADIQLYKIIVYKLCSDVIGNLTKFVCEFVCEIF